MYLKQEYRIKTYEKIGTDNGRGNIERNDGIKKADWKTGGD